MSKKPKKLTAVRFTAVDPATGRPLRDDKGKVIAVTTFTRLAAKHALKVMTSGNFSIEGER